MKMKKRRISVRALPEFVTRSPILLFRERRIPKEGKLLRVTIWVVGSPSPRWSLCFLPRRQLVQFLFSVEGGT